VYSSELIFYIVFAGLNCAEAVNFAPADWLPHGGSGAELYRLYHKAAVLSHDELLCVVAKVISVFSNSNFFLKKKSLKMKTYILYKAYDIKQVKSDPVKFCPWISNSPVPQL